MKTSKRILSMLLAIVLIIPTFVWLNPIKAKAAFSLDTGYGKITVTTIDNDTYNGKYRIRYKFSYTDAEADFYYLKLSNIKLVNSSGKTIYTWKDMYILEGGGTKEQNFTCDFSTLPSDTYYFKYTVSVVFEYGSTYISQGKSSSRQREITHSAGSVSYRECKYTTNTDGTKNLYVVFNMKMLSGKSPKLEIYDSNNNLIKTFTTKKTLSSNNTGWGWTWDMIGKNGLPVKDGTYTFKASCGGKSSIKKITIKYPN